MSTRANIIRINKPGSFKYDNNNLSFKFDLIYTHSDGYPEHHGPILLEHYNTSEKVAELLGLGDLSVLGPQIGEKHDFDWAFTVDRDTWANDPRYQWCRAYGRDRGEEDACMARILNVEELRRYLKDSDTEWYYFWDEAAGRWYFTDDRYDTPPSAELCSESIQAAMTKEG